MDHSIQDRFHTTDQTIPDGSGTRAVDPRSGVHMPCLGGLPCIYIASEGWRTGEHVRRTRLFGVFLVQEVVELLQRARGLAESFVGLRKKSNTETMATNATIIALLYSHNPR
jgi:hypothetical protein